MPVLTNSRNYVELTSLDKGQHKIAGSKVTTEHGYTISGSQTTTSYRSGRRAQASSKVDGEELVDGNENRSDFLQKLQKESKRGGFDRGNEFSTRKQETAHTSVVDVYAYPELSLPTRKHEYRGPIYLFAPVGVSPFPEISLPSISRINADGRACIAATLPTAPESGLAAFLGELKERLPSVIGYETYRNGLSSRGTGSEYLNVQFGIRPLIGDVEKLAASVSKASELIRKYERNAGANVRRGVTLRDKGTLIDRGTQTNSFEINRRQGASVTSDFLSRSGSPACRVMDNVHESVWFKGAYTYHLEQNLDLLNRLRGYEQRANYLLGTRITPDVIYQLTPWSWLFDWFGDLGTFVKNITYLNSDGLVLRYGYVMHQTSATRELSMPYINPTNNGNGVRAGVRSFYSITEKKRTRATPYGFGLDIGALSPKQWSILGALGMTRSPRNLRYGSF